MPELEIAPHPEEQRNLEELRSEFRAENLERIRVQFAGVHPVGWHMIGDPSNARDGYSSSAWAEEMLYHLDKPCVQDFGLNEVPFTLSVKLEELARKSELHESATWQDGTEGTFDHDGPECDLAAMNDDQICEYVEMAIQESARG